MADKITKNRFSDIEFGHSIGIADEGTINFSRAHSAAPTVVIANNSYSSDRIVSAYNATATGFSVFAKTLNGTATSSWIDWIAIWGGYLKPLFLNALRHLKGGVWHE